MVLMYHSAMGHNNNDDSYVDELTTRTPTPSFSSSSISTWGTFLIYDSYFIIDLHHPVFLLIVGLQGKDRRNNPKIHLCSHH